MFTKYDFLCVIASLSYDTDIKKKSIPVDFSLVNTCM